MNILHKTATRAGMSLVVALGVLSLCLAPNRAKAEPGVTDSQILVGQSAVLSGPSARLGIEMREGIDAAFTEINRTGGVAGRQLKLITLDDHYEPESAAENTKTLIYKDGVFGLLGYVGTPTSKAALPIFTQAKVPFIGPFTGAELLRAPFNRYVFNIRASYREEGQPLVNLMAQYGRVALVVQDDSYGAAIRDAVQRAMDQLGMKPVAVGVIKRNSLDVSQAAAKIEAANANAVILGTVYGAAGELIKELHARGAWPVVASVSFIGTSAVLDDLRTAAVGMGITQVVPPPLSGSYAVVRTYQSAMRAAGHNNLTYGSEEGYIAARVFAEGLRRCGREVTRERFISALEGLGKYDLGGFAVDFSPSNHNGSHYVDLTVVSSDLEVLH